jgi:hypothetical protein
MEKEEKEQLLEKIKKASESEYMTEWDSEGRIGVQKELSNIKKGKKSKISGNKFELVVRRDLEEKGWIVTKWSNNYDLVEDKIIQAKRKFNPFSKVMTIGTGFPDFVAFQSSGEKTFKVIGVEVKLNGLLSKEEKEKSKKYLQKNTFSELWLAKAKDKKASSVEYIDLNEVIKRMR